MFNINFVEEIDVRFQVDFVWDVGFVFQTQFTKNDAPPYYHGSYEVVPKREEQQLETANKICSQNVVVLEVPYSMTSNLAGGTTIYIAKETNE